MQLVPKSGGLDAYHYVYGEKKVLAPEYFFQPNQNVELGVAYLDLLYRRYLRAIKDDQSRLFCTIAAYNTGAGNVAKAFTGANNVRVAASVINEMSSDEVYTYLLENLPYDETRNYLRKVTAAQARYAETDNNI
jgi:membrane-bound lytic murein transglycosylase C